MEANKLKDILVKHLKWLNDEEGGTRADLYGADLSRANLSGANLSGADLSCADLYGADLSCADLSRAGLYGADLSRANLSCADLSGADLSCADLSGADLSCADLSRANLYGADLSRANLSGADLSRANLSGANLSGADLSCANLDMNLINKFFPICCPEYGAFIAWKKANGFIIKLHIPEDAKRSSAFGRKCRASKAICLAIENPDGTPSDATSVPSSHDGNFIYTVGATAEVSDFDEDRTHECAPGIHFFITRQEAVDY